jgi:hypothetical protein
VAAPKHLRRAGGVLGIGGWRGSDEQCKLFRPLSVPPGTMCSEQLRRASGLDLDQVTAIQRFRSMAIVEYRHARPLVLW